MTLNEELLTYLLDYFPYWGSSPRAFHEFIRATARLSNLAADLDSKSPKLVVVDENELADIFLRVFDVDLKPYRNYDELKSDIASDPDIAALLEKMHSRSVEEDQFNELVADNDLQPSLETVLESLMQEERTRSTISRLRPYIHFV